MARIRQLGGLAIAATAISLVSIGAFAGPARSAPAPAASVTSFSIPGQLHDVAATSPSNAWAVGSTGTGNGLKTLIVHWNGKKWSQVTSPKPLFGYLQSVTAVSASDVWAAGATGGDAAILIMHWNGKAWSRQAGVPEIPGALNSVAVSGSSVWAVGQTDDLLSPLILHWTGNHWYLVPTEAPADTEFFGITETGRNAAWAGGGYTVTGGRRGILMRWNGTAWKSVPNPLQGANNVVYRLAASPSGAVWAVGDDLNQKLTAFSATSMLWNGKTWRKVPFGPLPRSSLLDGVTFIPGGTAWAVGFSYISALILHWTGHAWVQLPTPDDGLLSDLFNVDATSTDNAWAVGFVTPHSVEQTLILHWNGRTWS